MTANWAGNLTYSSSGVHAPATVEQVQEIVAGAARVKALGTRHSFSAIADTDGEHVSTEKLNRIISLENGRVTIEAGVRYGELGRFLAREGWALPNLASLPHISVAGACATATHGSGDRNQCLTGAVQSMDFVTASGELVTMGRADPRFPGAAVHLGALGVVVRLTLDLVPSFQLCQQLYLDLPLETARATFDELTSAGYSVSLFTSWRSVSIEQVWVKGLASRSGDLLGARPATAQLHPLPDMPVENCTEQLGVFGDWDERLPHFRREFTPSSGDELQSEYLIPREHAPDALRCMATLGHKIAPLLHISEIRTIAADDFWMSPFFGRDSVGIHFTWKPLWPEVSALLLQIEAALAPFEARPHWGKLFVKAPPLPGTLNFAKLCGEMDQDRKFQSGFLGDILSAT